MPIIIEELVVRSVVSDSDSEEGEGAANALSDEARHEIIEACVKEVLRVLEDAKER